MDNKININNFAQDAQIASKLLAGKSLTAASQHGAGMVVDKKKVKQEKAKEEAPVTAKGDKVELSQDLKTEEKEEASVLERKEKVELSQEFPPEKHLETAQHVGVAQQEVDDKQVRRLKRGKEETEGAPEAGGEGEVEEVDPQEAEVNGLAEVFTTSPAWGGKGELEERFFNEIAGKSNVPPDAVKKMAEESVRSQMQNRRKDLEKVHMTADVVESPPTPVIGEQAQTVRTILTEVASRPEVNLDLVEKFEPVAVDIDLS